VAITCAPIFLATWRYALGNATANTDHRQAFAWLQLRIGNQHTPKRDEYEWKCSGFGECKPRRRGKTVLAGSFTQSA
jgi:hypothetical protein